MRRLGVGELGGLERGSLVVVRWLDASDIRCGLKEHEANPEVHCKDWGVYLGCSGRKRKLLILGKDVVEVFNEWGATRIPLELVEEVVVVLEREDMVGSVQEINTLSRRIRLRRYDRRRERFSVYTR